MGRPLTTGRYATREELVEAVWYWWADAKPPYPTVVGLARMVRVSEMVVHKILSEPRPKART